MTVTGVTKDLDALTMIITAAFDAPIESVWQLWADPRKLERWWGPPTHPATFAEHDLVPDGVMKYFMTGPDGSQYHGWWKVRSVEAPTRLVLEDGFADDDGNNNPDLPVTLTDVTLTATASTTTMAITSRFPSREAMEQVISMGVEEGMTTAMGQMDAILAE